jgi:hypothetical protein
MKNSIKQKLYQTVLFPLPDKYRYVLSHYRMHKRFGNHTYRLNLDNPRTFNEKISWLKLYHRFKEGKIIADKYLVREYVEERIGSRYLIPLIDYFTNTTDIDYELLPESFVLKPNHGSGWVIICPDKGKADLRAYNERLNNWMEIDFAYISGEWQYRGIEKKILCEELIQELTDIVDYKFYCFNGEPKLAQVDFDRHVKHTRSFYDLSWKKMDLSLLYPPANNQMPRPSGLAEMIEVAGKLAQPFTFCRIDLYDVNGKVYFGEITLHPEAGNGPFQTYQQDLQMGQLLDISHLLTT